LPIDPSTAFVSYSREDLEFVLRLAKDLKAKGAKVWMDKLDLRPGQRWEIEVQTALDGCQRMLVILSPTSVASSNVLAEAAFAIDEGKEVIPVLVRECKIPFRLRPFQYADFRSEYTVGLEELFATLIGVQAATPNGAAAEAGDRERLEEERKQREQAEAERLAAVAESKRKQQEEAEAGRLSAEAGRKQQEQAEAERLAAVAETARKQQERAEAERLAALAEAERKQREQAEAALLAAEEDRKQQEQAEAERLA